MPSLRSVSTNRLDGKCRSCARRSARVSGWADCSSLADIGSSAKLRVQTIVNSEIVWTYLVN